MSATLHSYHAFVLVDPVQDYEETAVILGVYGSESAARRAAPRLERDRGQWRNGYGTDCYFEIQQWAGDELLRAIKLPASSGQAKQ